MIASYALDFCDIDVYTNYAVVVIHEGITTSPENLKEFQKLIDIHYGDKPFVYISHRINSFSINPSIHLESSKIPNLVGFAIVSDHPLQKKQFKIEKAFFSKAFQLFDTMEAALKWKDEIIRGID